MLGAVHCGRLVNYRPVPLKQIIYYMLIIFKKESIIGFRLWLGNLGKDMRKEEFP